MHIVLKSQTISFYMLYIVHVSHKLEPTHASRFVDEFIRLITYGDTAYALCLSYHYNTGVCVHQCTIGSWQRSLTGLFVVNATSGVVSTRADLKGWAGAHNLTVEVRDGGSPSLRSTTTVLITVLEGNNGAPIWDYPTDNNATVTIIEVSSATHHRAVLCIRHGYSR